MRTEVTTADKIRGLPWVFVSNGANSVFCVLTVFGSVLMLFLSRLGLPKTKIGFLLALFPFAALLAPLVASPARRLGVKRTYMIFWGIRKFVAAGLIATPLVLAKFGASAVFPYVTAVLLAFAVCRAIAETARYPWVQEHIPDSIRGRAGAVVNITSTISGMCALAFASIVIGRGGDLAAFQVVMAIGVLFGLASVWASSRVPGGAPLPETAGDRNRARRFFTPLRDRNFVTFLTGVGLVTLALTPSYGFFFLFMKEQVGLAEGRVVSLEIFGALGACFTVFLWGWAADRFGSKPVMMCGIAGVLLVLLLLWGFAAFGGAFKAAAGIAALWGMTSSAWFAGYGRMLYVSIVPQEEKTEYMAVYYMWLGITGGFGPLVAGAAIDACAGLGGTWLAVPVNQYTPLFLAAAACVAAGGVILSLVRAGGEMAAMSFVGMFLQGNPVRALWSTVRWSRAGEETTRVTTAESLGVSRSPLNVEDLLDALADPSFNVRYEAIISMARTRAGPRLIEALVEVLDGDEPDLSVAAAWALGRMGARGAVPSLRKALDSGYPLLRARSARALAALDDAQIAPQLQRHLALEEEQGVRIALASALGALRATDAAPEILRCLAAAGSPSVRNELALALARMVGVERPFVRLQRSSRADFGTTSSQVLSSIGRRQKPLLRQDKGLRDILDGCIQALAHHEIARASTLLAQVIRSMPEDRFPEAARAILDDCAGRLESLRGQRTEYALLALAIMNAA